MKRQTFIVSSLILAAMAVVAACGTLATAEPAGDAANAMPEGMQLPAGWTAADMQACIMAGTPGKMHEMFAQDAGKWSGTSTMWMTPDSEPVESQSTSTITMIMDGRYAKCEMEGEMPGMGPYHGFGLYAYDNVSKKFASTWIDNHSTGIMVGEGELSEDGKTLTWTYTFNCPLTNKPAKMREVETTTGENSKTIEMFAADPKSGKEFKMMSIKLTRG